MAYASLLALCYLVALVNSEDDSENVAATSSSRNKRSLDLGEFRPRNLFGTLVQQGS